MAEVTTSGALQARFVYATKPHVPDYMAASGTNYRIITDHLGSVRLVVNASTGVIAQRLDYNEFGNVLLDTSPGFQPFGFAGGLYDSTTGLVKFGARDYDPALGRWATKDPVNFGGGDTNLYVYVGNDPINFIDPNGLEYIPSACDPEGTYWLALQDLPLERDYTVESIIIGGMTTKVVLRAAAPLVNANRYLRIGPGRHGAERVFRASGDVLKWAEKKFPGADKIISNGHIDFWTLRPW